MDTHEKRQLYRVILRIMTWIILLVMVGIFLRGCFA